MNYLAHVYLSGANDLIKVGNFMADSVKGSQYLNYEKELQHGILLHRHIDSYTDAHPIYRQSKHRLHEKYGHYSGVIMDILYDHFLRSFIMNIVNVRFAPNVSNSPLFCIPFVHGSFGC